MIGIIHLFLHVLIYSGSTIILYFLRRRLSLIPLYIYLGIILVFTSMMSSFYVLEVVEGISVGGGSIAYAGVLWTVLYVYVMERDFEAIKLLILGILAVQFVFLFVYPYFGYLLSYDGTTNPLTIPPELFDVSFGIFWVGNLLALLEMVVMIFLLEKMKERFPSIPSVIHVALVYSMTLLIDSILYPLFAYPITQSISIIQGVSSVTSKLLLGLSYSVMLIAGTMMFKRRRRQDTTEMHLKLSDLVSLPKTKVIDAWRRAKNNQEMVSLLLRILSHDIRNYNSITIIALETLLMEHPDLDDNVQEMLNEIQKVQYQSTELLSNTVTLKALQDGNIPSKTVELRKELLEVQKRVGIAYPSVELEFCDSERMTEVYIQGNALLDVALYNILSNMVKYRKPEQDTVCVEVSLQIEDGHLHLILSDNGVGIPDRAKQQVFDSIQSRPRYSGFGLYLVRAILSAADAEIWVENRPDWPNDHSKGTAFHMRFLLAGEEPATGQASSLPH